MGSIRKTNTTCKPNPVLLCVCQLLTFLARTLIDAGHKRLHAFSVQSHMSSSCVAFIFTPSRLLPMLIVRRLCVHAAPLSQYFVHHHRRRAVMKHKREAPKPSSQPVDQIDPHPCTHLATLSEFFCPKVGISTIWSQSSSTAVSTPMTSFPSTRHSLRGNSRTCV